MLKSNIYFRLVASNNKLLDYGSCDVVDPAGDRWNVGQDDRGGSGRAEAVGRRSHELAVQNTAVHHRRPPGTLKKQRDASINETANKDKNELSNYWA